MLIVSGIHYTHVVCFKHTIINLVCNINCLESASLIGHHKYKSYVQYYTLCTCIAHVHICVIIVTKPVVPSTIVSNNPCVLNIAYTCTCTLYMTCTCINVVLLCSTVCTVVSCNHSVCLFKALVVCRNAKAIWDIPQTLYTVQIYMIDNHWC